MVDNVISEDEAEPTTRSSTTVGAVAIAAPLIVVLGIESPVRVIALVPVT